MLNYRKGRVFFGSLLLIFAFLEASCTKEDTTDCDYTFLLDVRAYASVGGADASADVEDVVLYVFDRDQLFVEQIETTVGSTVEIKTPKSGSVTVIAWGNLSGGREISSTLNASDPLDLGEVNLITTRAARFCLSPDDLFYGSLTLTESSANAKDAKELSLYRRTGSMSITVKGWESYFPNAAPEDISIVVGETYSSLSFLGETKSDKIDYAPAGAPNASNDYYVSPFNMIPDESLVIIISVSGYPPVTVTQDSSGKTLSVEAGETTHVLLDFSTSLEVIINITEWGKEIVWKDF